MALDAGTPEVTETAIEQPTDVALEATPTTDTPVIEPQADAPEVATDASEVTEAVEETADEPVAEETHLEAAPITFDATVETELPELKTKITELLDSYDLTDAPNLQAAIDVLIAKAEATPDVAIAQELADYGEPEVIKTALERDAYLSSVTHTEDGWRPNTDKFVADLVQRATPEVVDHLYFDVARTPSQKYPGVTRFEEGIVDAIAVQGDTVGSALERYQEMVTYAKSGSVPIADVPSYIPVDLHPAYKALSKASRDEYDAYDPAQDGEYDYSANRTQKLAELRQMQKGIDADYRENQRVIQDQQQRQQQFTQQVYQTQRSFYDGVRDQFTEALKAEAVFPTELAMRQNVTLLMQACQDDSDGEYARAALTADGIKFDFPKVQQMTAEVDKVTLELTNAKNTVDANGRQLNEIALRTATRNFETVTRKWLEFGKDILMQEQKLTATGTAKAVEAEVAKIKIAPKARTVPKGVATAAKVDTKPSLYRNRDAFVNSAMEEEARRARPYAPA